MKIERQFAVRMAIESLLIVFSVLLALFLNEAWSRRTERAATHEQLASIRAELEDNQKIVAGWADRHEAIRARVVAARSGESTEPLIVDGRLRLDRVLGQSLADSMVRDTAWQTARTTGLVRNFDLQCANMLTDVYGLQKVVEDQIWKIAGIFSERETHQEEHLGSTLVLLEFSLEELQGQEWLLASGCEEALAMFDRNGCGP